MRHQITPTEQVGPQARAAGFAEPYRSVALYRFVDAAGALLYVGITSRPVERWQKHQRSAVWWPLVSDVLVEVYAQRHDAEAAELRAIKTERPRFNVHAVPTGVTNEVEAIPNSFTHYSRVVLPRVGGGVGGGEGCGTHPCLSSYWGGSSPVENAADRLATGPNAWMAADAAEIGGGR